MKLKIKIFFLILFSSFSCFASHITLDQQKLFSELDKLSNDLENDDIWALYIRKFGHDKVMLRFPKSPKLILLSNKKESYCVQCENDDADYQLFVQPLNGRKSNILKNRLQKIEADLSSRKLEHFTKKESKNVLDISYDEKDVHVSKRIIVTDENVFTLISKHPNSLNSSDTYFIHSFSILNS